MNPKNKLLAWGDYNAKPMYLGSRLIKPKGRQDSDRKKKPDLIDFNVINNIDCL